MSRADIWMPLYIADYAGDTLHLTTEQHGAYLLLLMACWMGGGRLPNDRVKLAAIAKATPGEWRKLSKIVLPFFKKQGKWLVHKRVLSERAKADQLIETKRKNGAKGGRPKSYSKPIANLQPKLQGNLDETPARVAVSTVEDIHCPIQEGSLDSNPSERSAVTGSLVAIAGGKP